MRIVLSKVNDMNALVVGADRLGNIPGVLAEYGISIKSHVSGRDRSHQRAAGALPSGIGIQTCSDSRMPPPAETSNLSGT